jgi:hypothetical protein
LLLSTIALYAGIVLTFTDANRYCVAGRRVQPTWQYGDGCRLVVGGILQGLAAGTFT